MIDPQFNVELQDLANKYQVHIVGKATPVAPDEDAFDISAQVAVVEPAPVAEAVPAPAPSEEAPSEVAPL